MILFRVNKQSLHEVFVISRIIKVKVSVIIENKDKRTEHNLFSTSHVLTLLSLKFTLLLEIKHCMCNLQTTYICSRLVKNLYVAMFPRTNCKLLATDKTDDHCNE